MAIDPATPEIPPELVGKWIAWDRHRTTTVGYGESFGAAKQAAAQAGCREVTIAKVPAEMRWYRSKHLLCVVAVFISQAADALPDLSDFGW